MQTRGFVYTSIAVLTTRPPSHLANAGSMTGFSALPAASSSSSSGSWTGAARIKGPKWARMPLLTVGMLGLQIVWSVEMGYGAHPSTTVLIVY